MMRPASQATAASPAREEQTTFITVQENVSDRRRRIELGQEPIFKWGSDLQLYVRADHQKVGAALLRCNWLQRRSRSRQWATPRLNGQQRIGSSAGAPPEISSTTFASLSQVKLRRATLCGGISASRATC